MSSIQFLSKVTLEMTNGPSPFVPVLLNMSVFDEMVDIFLSTLRSGGDRHGYRLRC